MYVFMECNCSNSKVDSSFLAALSWFRMCTSFSSTFANSSACDGVHRSRVCNNEVCWSCEFSNARSAPSRDVRACDTWRCLVSNANEDWLTFCLSWSISCVPDS